MFRHVRVFFIDLCFFEKIDNTLCYKIYLALLQRLFIPNYFRILLFEIYFYTFLLTEKKLNKKYIIMLLKTQDKTKSLDTPVLVTSSNFVYVSSQYSLKIQDKTKTRPKKNLESRATLIQTVK